MATQIKIIKGNTGWGQNFFIEEIANRWLNENEKSIDVIHIRYSHANGSERSLLMIIYSVKAGKKIKDTYKGEKY